VGDGSSSASPPPRWPFIPAEENGRHELYFLVDDVKAVVAAMKSRKVRTGSVQEQDWGRLVDVSLPGGGTRVPIAQF
jgi:hypothetical protein